MSITQTDSASFNRSIHVSSWGLYQRFLQINLTHFLCPSTCINILNLNQAVAWVAEAAPHPTLKWHPRLGTPTVTSVLCAPRQKSSAKTSPSPLQLRSKNHPYPRSPAPPSPHLPPSPAAIMAPHSNYDDEEDIDISGLSLAFFAANFMARGERG